MNNSNINQSDFLVNSIYMTAISLELMLLESERMLNRKVPPEGWKYEKKRMFNNFTDYVKKACTMLDQIHQDIYDVEKKNDYKYVSVWQEEANELARFILMIADRTSDPEIISEIHDFIKSRKGDGFSTEELLNKFYLKKYDK